MIINGWEKEKENVFTKGELKLVRFPDGIQIEYKGRYIDCFDDITEAVLFKLTDRDVFAESNGWTIFISDCQYVKDNQEIVIKANVLTLNEDGLTKVQYKKVKDETIERYLKVKPKDLKEVVKDYIKYTSKAFAAETLMENMRHAKPFFTPTQEQIDELLKSYEQAETAAQAAFDEMENLCRD